MKPRPTIAFFSMLLLLLLLGGAPAQRPVLAVPGAEPRTPGAVLAQSTMEELDPPSQQAPDATTAWMIERADAPVGAALGHHSLALDAAGRPHLAYCGDLLYYAWHDGVSWHRETVDDTTRVGRDCALALDAAGRPHISYLDEEIGALKYARFDGVAWHVETVDSGWNNGGIGYTSLALDSAGQIHISYYGANLKYAHYDGVAWHIETLETVARRGLYNSLALDAAGRPHISYHDDPFEGGSLVYAHFDGSAWITTTVDAGPRVGMYSALALDAAGRPHISYCAGGLKYAYYDGTAWIVEVVDRDPRESSNTSLALDSAGHPHISYADVSNFHFQDLKYAHYDGHAWQVETVGAGSGLGTSLAVDGAGQPHIGYVAGGLQYASSYGGAWQIDTVDHMETVGGIISLALDSADQPHLAYCVIDLFTRYCIGLKYAHYDGAVWQVTTVPSAAWGDFPSLALDAADRPHIGYFGNYALQYAYYDGMDWIVTTAGPGGWYPSLQLDSAGQPHISYYNYASHSLNYLYSDGQDWYTQTVDAVGVQGGATSLALDAAGRPHIAYHGRRTLRYAWFDGTTWLTTTVDSTGYVDGSASLALDTAGRPHIAYCLYDGYQQACDNLRYAYDDGTGWITATADSAGYAGGFSSLALDAAGRPHISYYVAWPTDKLRYAYFDGSAWLTATVDSAYQFGESSSLALDAAGRPHIGYADSSHGDVKYAHLIDCVPVETVTVAGPAALPAGSSGLYTASYAPPSATLRSLTWDNGARGDQAMYEWLLTGTHRLTATADYYCAATTGPLTVTVFCQPPTGAAIQGPGVLVPGLAGFYAASAAPITTSPPLTFTWDNGTVGTTAAYSWSVTGMQTVTVTVTNRCGQSPGLRTVRVLAAWPYSLYLPPLLHDEP